MANFRTSYVRALPAGPRADAVVLVESVEKSFVSLGESGLSGSLEFPECELLLRVFGDVVSHEFFEDSGLFFGISQTVGSQGRRRVVGNQKVESRLRFWFVIGFFSGEFVAGG